MKRLFGFVIAALYLFSGSAWGDEPGLVENLPNKVSSTNSQSDYNNMTNWLKGATLSWNARSKSGDITIKTTSTTASSGVRYVHVETANGYSGVLNFTDEITYHNETPAYVIAMSHLNGNTEYLEFSFTSDT